ncbi:hypothetical protein CIPAW_10G131600 [Carya illinoinensis]|uniref:Uncharacterized protein n=2 Tax=Carya illinoinensis TaxID=32201 RepID=A0A8T1PDT5_CARIL|nr:hypothetical protein CIPAW_10G131600 [Carya illinoinensis]
MINMISKYTPRSLSVNASKRTCCIFKVPHTFVGNSYHLSVVSIRPYHRGMTQLMMIEEHKWRYLKSLLCRKQTKTFEDYLESIEPLEKDAREYYSEIIQLKSHEFIEMMVLDGCFMIEVFRKIKDPRQFEAGDPLLTVGWILPFLYTDFLLLENQIPFFILEKLFEISKMPSEESSLSLLAMQFFNEATALRRPDDFICRFHDLKGWHLLDLVRLSFVPEEEITQSSGTPTHIMHSISKLHGSGIKLNLAKAESFLVVKFKNGVIEMPRIRLDELMGSFLSNCVAFEQCHCDVSKHFTTYATFLECLVESAQDVGYLRHHNIMENNLGNDDEVACFINKMGKDVMIDSDSYLSKLFKNVDEYYRNSWNLQWATFKHKYFDTPWSFISALAAFVLLSLAIAQTFYTIYAYKNRNDGSPSLK